MISIVESSVLSFVSSVTCDVVVINLDVDVSSVIEVLVETNILSMLDSVVVDINSWVNKLYSDEGDI